MAESAKLKDDAIPVGIQECLCTAVAFRNDKRVEEIVQNIDPLLFDEPLNDILIKCLKYREKYGKAPGRQHIDDVFAEFLDRSHKKYQSYHRVLTSMLRLEPELNLDFVADVHQGFARARTQRIAIHKAAQLYQGGREHASDEIDRVFQHSLEESSKAGQPAFDAVPISSFKMKPMVWYWRPYLPVGKAVAICGLPDAGKSILMCEIAAVLSTGDKWPDGSDAAPPVNVLFVSTEDTANDVVRPRLVAAGADESRIRWLTMRGKVFSLKHDLPRLEALLERYDIGAVFIEPFYAFTGDKTDTYRDSSMQQLMAPVIALLDRYETTLFANIHFNKNNDGPAIDRITGARGTAGSFRAAYLVHIDPDNNECTLFLKIKNNLAPRNLTGWRFEYRTIDVAPGITAPRIKWIEEDTRTADEVLQAKKKNGRPSDKGEAAEEFLRDLLAEGPVAVADIRRETDQAGHNWATVKYASERLEIEKQKQGFGDSKWVWKLKKN